MDANSDQRELREYLSVLVRRRRLIAVITVIPMVLALTLAFLETPTYRATAELLFESGSARIIVEPAFNRGGDPQRLLQNEVQFAESDRVNEVAEDRSGVSGEVSVVVSQPTGDIMFMTADADDADDAALIANSHAEAYIDLRREQAVEDYRNTIEVTQSNLEDIQRAQFESSARIGELNTELGTAGPNTDVNLLTAERNSLQANQSTLFDQAIRLNGNLRELNLGFDLADSDVATVTLPAEPPSSPASPQPVRNAAVGLLAGFMLAVGIAFVVDYLDDSVKTKDRLDLFLRGRTPTLAQVPIVDSWTSDTDTPLISVEEPRGPVAEAYRTLRTALSFVNIDDEPKVVQLTSADAGEGKTATAVNLAVASARAGHRVLIIDADLRRPRVHSFLGVTSTPGLITALRNGTTAGAVQTVSDVEGLSVMAAGGIPPDPSELLASDSVEPLIVSLRDEYDMIVIDSPPVLPVSDALSVSRVAEALIVVVNASTTSIRSLGRALERIEQVDAPLVGVVLNEASEDVPYYESYAGPTADVADGPPAGETQDSDGGHGSPDTDDSDAADGPDLDDDLADDAGQRVP